MTDGDEGTPPEQPWSRLRHRAWEQVALILTIVLFGIVAARLYLVSRGDVTTFKSLLQYADPVPLALSLAPTLLSLIGFAAFIPAERVWSIDSATRWRNGVLLFLCGLLQAFFLTLVEWLVFALLVFVLGWIDHRRKARPPEGRGEPSEETAQDERESVGADVGETSEIATPWAELLLLGVTLAFVVWYFSSTLSEPWLPANRIELRTERLVGFVLEETDDELVVLRADDRAVVRVAAAEIEQRETCVAQQRDRPLIFYALTLSAREPRYPNCG
jgi:hypothetical protein